MEKSKQQHLLIRRERSPMKKTILFFLISTVICGFGTLAFWYLSGNANDLRYLSDYFFLSGAAFFVAGMAIALFATSRWHYYRHLKKKWQGKESDEAFDKGEKERKKKMLRGTAIALSGLIGFAVSGYIAIKIGY